MGELFTLPFYSVNKVTFFKGRYSDWLTGISHRDVGELRISDRWEAGSEKKGQGDFQGFWF